MTGTRRARGSLVALLGVLLILPALGCGKDPGPAPMPTTAGPWAERRRAEVAAAKVVLSVEMGEDAGIDIRTSKGDRIRFDPVITKNLDETPLSRWDAYVRKWLADTSQSTTAATNETPLEIVEVSFPPTTSWWGPVLSLVSPLKADPTRNLVVRLRAGTTTPEGGPPAATVDLRFPEDTLLTCPPLAGDRTLCVTLDAEVTRGVVHAVEVRTTVPANDGVVFGFRFTDLGNLDASALGRVETDLGVRSSEGARLPVLDRFVFVLASYEQWAIEDAPQWLEGHWLEGTGLANRDPDSKPVPRPRRARPGGKEWLTAGRVLPVLGVLRRLADRCGGTLCAFRG